MKYVTDPTEKIAKIEMQRYMADAITDQYDSQGYISTLVWWKQNATCYPCLTSLARKYSDFITCRKSVYI